MARAIKLKRFAIKDANHYHLRGFRLRVEVAEVAGGMDPFVFVYRRHPPNPTTGVIFDEFIGVASFPDLAEYPVGDPDPDKALPYFRLSWLEVDVRSVSHYNYVWQLLVTEVCTLANILDKADQLVVAEEVWCPRAPEPTPSDSSASSQSAP